MRKKLSLFGNKIKLEIVGQGFTPAVFSYPLIFIGFFLKRNGIFCIFYIYNLKLICYTITEIIVECYIHLEFSLKGNIFYGIQNT